MSVKALKQWVRQTAAKTVWAYGPDKLVRQLKACGVVPGCTLIVHSSWLPFNGFQGKPADVVRALKEAVGPEGLLVMIQEGKLTRISLVELSPVKTDKGLGIGDAAYTVKLAYGDAAKATPHKYQDKPAEYITAWAGGPRSEPYVEDEAARGIVYEVDGTGKVGAVHAGVDVAARVHDVPHEEPGGEGVHATGHRAVELKE